MKREKQTADNPTTDTTTEDELLRIIGSQTRMTAVCEQVAGLVTSQDWASLVASLQTNEVLLHAPLVSSLIKDILGPISEAQGIAKAVIGVIATVIDMYLNARANTVKCQKLGRQLGDVEPCLRFLLAALSKKTSALLAAKPLEAAQTLQFRREVESLKRPLETLMITAKGVQTTITEWTAKGTRLFGAVRQMLQAKSYYYIFAEHSADISHAVQSMEVALAAMTFLNVNEVQAQLMQLPDQAASSKLMQDAIVEDEKNFSHEIKSLLKRDVEFKQELENHWDEIGSHMNSHFGDLHTYLDEQFHKVIGKIDGISKDVSAIHGVAKNVSNLHDKMDEILLQNKGGSGKLLLVIDADGVIDKIGAVLKILRSFNKDTSSISRVLRDVPLVLSRCRELVDNISVLNIRTAYCAVTLKHFGQDLDAIAVLLKKWLLKSAAFQLQKKMFFNGARLSRLHDMMAGLKDFQDKLMQVLHATEDGLGEARKGTFRNYDIVVNEKARNFWVSQFPGRAEVPLGEFCSTIRWQPFLANLDDLGRTRLFYWLKCTLDKDGNQQIDIQEWNRFTSGGDFETIILDLARARIPDEDGLDNDDSKSPVVGRAKEPGGAQKNSNALYRVSSDLKDEDLRSIGILSVAPAENGIEVIDIGLLVDCTSTMGNHISKLYDILPTLIKGFQRNSPGAVVRVAFVGYRDVGDKEPLCVYPFTERLGNVLKFIKEEGEACGGGGDAAEDVFAGLERAISLEWSFGKKVVRRLVHVADAPCHGTRYHDFAGRTKSPSWKDAQHKWDRFPEFDVDGSKGRHLMTSLARKKIDYTFVQVFRFTEKMTDQFKRWYNECPTKNLAMDIVPLGKIDELPTTMANAIQISLASVTK